jgi:hypothetical protein
MGKKEEEKEKKKKRIPRGRRNREPRDRLVKEKELNDEEDQVTNRRTRGPLGPPESLFLLFDYSAHAKIDTLWSLALSRRRLQRESEMPKYSPETTNQRTRPLLFGVQ